MKKTFLWAYGCVILLCIFALIQMHNNEGFAHIQQLNQDQLYRILTTEQIPRETAASFCVTHNRLFILYDNTGLVNTYSLDGEFLYGIQFRTIRNGTGHIACEDNTLFIQARGSRMYIFEDGAFIRSFSRKEDPSEYARIESITEQLPNHYTNGETYYYLTEVNRISKTSFNGELIKVIDMPQQNPNIESVGRLLLVAVASLTWFLGVYRKPTPSIRSNLRV